VLWGECQVGAAVDAVHQDRLTSDNCQTPPAVCDGGAACIREEPRGQRAPVSGAR
jgi:hypothetical protein